MDPLARRVAARWGWSVATAGEQPAIPAWVVEWGDRTFAASLKTAYADTLPGMPAVQTDQQLFQTARESISILLPHFLALLQAKFKERYTMNASASGTRIYYYFASKHPLETIALTMVVHQHRIFMSLMYAPIDLHGHVDYKRAVEMKEFVEDPELAGLALTRLGRKVLARV
jgi:hypothetical protein